MIFVLRPLIEFCASNVASGAEPAKEILEKDSDLDVLEYGCLDYCHECGLSLFAFVEGEPVKGDTPEELVENIYRFIKEHSVY